MCMVGQGVPSAIFHRLWLQLSIHPSASVFACLTILLARIVEKGQGVMLGVVIGRMWLGKVILVRCQCCSIIRPWAMWQGVLFVTPIFCGSHRLVVWGRGGRSSLLIPKVHGLDVVQFVGFFMCNIYLASGYNKCCLQRSHLRSCSSFSIAEAVICAVNHHRMSIDRRSIQT